MTTIRMHADEVGTSVGLVRKLLGDQFPQWAGLPLEPAIRSGTDNAIFRLGGDMAVRLPRIHWAAGQVAKEQRWLPVIAPHLPIPVPVPLAMGLPGEGYPWNWSVYPWIEGDNAGSAGLVDPEEAAVALAGFVAALQGIETADGPVPGEHNSHRGEPLAMRDGATRNALGELRGEVDWGAALEVWDMALNHPWDGVPRWVHGDLQPGNILVRNGKVAAVIDFGCLGIGDPACDLTVAWNLLDARGRSAFREAIGCDDATWVRGRGWALSIALIALPYYRETNPALAETARRTIDGVFRDLHRKG